MLHVLQESDPNYKVCVDFALSNINNSKYMSVNSHEIRRQINGLAERFEILNYKRYGDQLKELCKSFCFHPICKDHCETDIEYKILSFLLNTSRNPIEGITSNKQDFNFDALKKEVSLIDKDKSDLVPRSSFAEQEFSDSDLSVSKV